jgi:outer membrane protein OmpA-like peptidoglycan-associated protein
MQSITFEFESAELTARGRAVLNNVGLALVSPQLAGAMIVVEGHTDASGSEQYNQDLSERRANSARTFLLSNFDLDADRLRAVGYGESRLLPGVDPLDAMHRRVTFVRPDE